MQTENRGPTRVCSVKLGTGGPRRRRAIVPSWLGAAGVYRPWPVVLRRGRRRRCTRWRRTSWCGCSHRSGPKFVFGLLIALILPVHRGAAILHGPDFDLARGPAMAATLCALRAEHDDLVVLREHVVDLDPKRAVGERHEVLEETQYLGMPAIIARQWSTARDMPEDILGEQGKHILHITAAEGVVTAQDERLVCFRLGELCLGIFCRGVVRHIRLLRIAILTQ